jgi:xylan 1,4-beta-xylosidase
MSAQKQHPRGYPLLFLSSFLLLLFVVPVLTQGRIIPITIDVQKALGPMEISRFALGQGGLSDDPIWPARIPEIRSLNPRLIRLFVQEYFDVYPQKGTYHWKTLDRSVDTILATGAHPLMCIAIKPKALFPAINQDTVEPNSYAEWEELIYQMVKHYKERQSSINYWEVANEPDIGEDGGCPSRFTAENYPRFYEHTAKAILRADPAAKVGGPALAYWRSPLLRALLEHCSSKKIPLNFVSWHIYNSNPSEIQDTIFSVRKLLEEFPALHCETFLNEWNMSLSNPAVDPRYQPCFIAEVAYRMYAAKLDYSCYYHIRDYHVSEKQFGRFMSPHGTLFMARWWNDMPQFDGLFDFQNVLRPAFFTFRLLSRLIGERLSVEPEAGEAQPHLMASIEPSRDRINVLIWNFALNAPPDASVVLQFSGIKGQWRIWKTTLDASTASNDENHRLRRGPITDLSPETPKFEINLAPYEVSLITLEKRDH